MASSTTHIQTQLPVNDPTAEVPTTLKATERELLQRFNDTAAAFPHDRLIHELFEQHVRSTPDAIAVAYEGQSLSYAELNRQANRLAHWLIGEGMRVGEYVPILMTRGLQMLIAQLAVLKSGAVYVPLDPQLPMERLLFTIRDCGARRILAERGRYAELESEAVQWIDCSEVSRALGNQPDHDPQPEMNEPPPAYVMYTSGSTGVPKGVVVPHRAVNRLAINNGYAHIEPTDCIAHCSNPAFDASTFEIWGALLNGASVLIVPPCIVLDAPRFAETLTKHRVTVLWMTVGLFAQYTEALASVFPQLRYLITGGDVVEPRTVRRVMDNPPRRLLNAYGPTECTTFSTTYLIKSLEACVKSIPIGRPISNAQIHILDGKLQPVPLGATGEIYIGGAGVALGYLNRPDLTAERFIADPFSADPQARLYKSGDLGRWRSDGNVEFLGRDDQQVKLRGFRIELGEIEAQLAQHPQVEEAVVLAREDTAGAKYLVAYVRRRAESTAGVEELRAHLQAVLPEYMVPSAFVAVESFPLTTSGKLDRRALPMPQLDAYVSRPYEIPRGAVEETLAAIWQELLRVERVGRHDNFFELGGHSLLVVQMMERLRLIGLSADLRRYFESPTLADLASALARGRAEQYDVPPNLIPSGCDAITSQMVPLVELTQEQIERIARAVPGGAANIQDIYPLAPLQEGILFHHKLDERGGDTYVLPVLLSLSTRLRLDQFIEGLQNVIDRHDILRTAVLSEQLPQPMQVIYRKAPLPVRELALDPRRDLLEQLKERLRPEQQKLDLRQAPPVRLQVVADPHSEQWYALLQLHHLICDHEAVETMLAEVKACVDGQAQELPEPVPYRNHVAQALAHARRHDAEPFFRRKLADIDGPTAPFGLLDVHGDGSRIDRVDRPIEPALARRIRTQSRRLGVSPATLFHAAWALVLARTTARNDVVFGTVLLGRLQGSAGAQRILGMFINTLPLRMRLENVTAQDLVALTQRELIELLDYEQTSLAVAQRCGVIAGSAPLFSTLINYLHSAVDIETGQPCVAPGIQVVASQEWTSYPIALSVYDQGEGFTLMAKTDRSVAPQRITDYMSTTMHSLVDALENSPQTSALSLSVLPEGEWRQVVRQFNATQAPYPQDKLIHELFEQQVKRTPDAVAVTHEKQSLTYAELNARANQLARYLRDKGVGPDRLVGIRVERSIELVIGLLGILKAGGAYVPLDPNYPPERVASMLRDAAPRVLLIQEQLRSGLPATSAELVALDSDWAEIARQYAGDLDPRALGLHSHHLAYVLYTSGSTGEPKGVMVEHRNVVSLWQSLAHVYRAVSGCERIGVNASFNFDASVKQFIQLLAGRTIVMIPQEYRWDAAKLLSFLEDQQVHGIDCTPSQLKSWLAEGLLEHSDCPLRVVLVGGEPIEPELWSSLSRSATIDFYNVYGPTESTVDATVARLRNDTRAPHIGRPMENRQIYLLDPRGQPVPVGVAGEIYIGGAGVARGYLNREELTAQRFVPDHFAADPDGRLYRTGDLAQWRADGTIEYLGRNDRQVKIRGFRIELGDIEAQLLRHAYVTDAAVLAREDELGEKKLVAYVATGLAHSKLLHQQSSEDASAEMVAQWMRVHDETYSADAVPGPSFVGWNSSYTGQPIVHAQMQEWLTNTVARIAALQPRRVLEIGTGVGLLLQHIAPQCALYVGTDFSAPAIHRLQQWVNGRPDLRHVELLHRAATELRDLQPGSFDTVVLNSVVQYFPDVDYLLEVLQDAVRLLAPGGKIFLGDIRHLGLLPMFHSAVQLSKAAASVSASQLRKRIARSIEQEKELVIDPQFFEALPGRLRGIAAADVQPKRGRAANELTRYRYDVVLHTGALIADRVFERLGWGTDIGSLAQLEAALAQRRWPALHVHSMPNPRLAREAEGQRLIETGDLRLEASALRNQLNDLPVDDVDPETCWELAQAYGYEAQIRWGAGDLLSTFEVRFLDRARADEVPTAIAAAAQTSQPWRVYANNPLENSLRQQLIPQLREHLKARLPDYMLPSAWMVMKELPLTPNGKVDRRALPAPESRPGELGDYVAPRTEMECTLAEIWAQVLRIDQVGVKDNFFDLGGHSLLAMQVVVRIRSTLSLDVPMRLLFEFPALERLAGQLDDLRHASLLDDIEDGGDDMEELLASVAAMPESEVRERVRELQTRMRP
jgi:amino acid adenylation domain-containing protein